MPDTAVENALALRKEMAEKIHAAEERIREWRARMERAERFISDWEEFSGERAPERGDGPTGGIVKRKNIPTSKPQNPKKEDVAEAARKILMEHGEPMSRDDLFTALAVRGITIHGKNPPVVLQTMLWRMQDVIVHLKGFGYWPADEAYQAAGYVDNSMPDKTEEIESLDDEAKTLI